jgi:hypothetical protein
MHSLDRNPIFKRDEPYTLTQAFQKAGFGKHHEIIPIFCLGKFQWIMMFLVLNAFISGNYLIQGTSFFLMQLDYLCLNEATGIFDMQC